LRLAADAAEPQFHSGPAPAGLAALLELLERDGLGVELQEERGGDHGHAAEGHGDGGDPGREQAVRGREEHACS
jgi:hypothetical protein